MVSFWEIVPSLVGYLLCGLAILHSMISSKNRLQRLIMLITLFAFGTWLEYRGVTSGRYSYPLENELHIGVVPLSVTLAWVGLIYSSMVIVDRMKLPVGLRLLMSTLITLSLDWGMDPIAVELGAWTWYFHGGQQGLYFGVPGFNFIGWLFIPLSYLLFYGISWNKDKKSLELWGIEDVDDDKSWVRKLYSFILVTPFSALVLEVVGKISRNEVIFNLSFMFMIIWASLTVFGTSLIVILKRKSLFHTKKYDIIPPLILCFISFSYTSFGLLIQRYDLVLLMIGTNLPLWLIFFFTLKKKKK
jgi:hypothetical protein